MVDCRAKRDYEEDITQLRAVTNQEAGNRRPEPRWLSIWTEPKPETCARGTCVKYLVHIHPTRSSQFEVQVGPFTLIAGIQWLRIFERDQKHLSGYKVGAHYTARVLLRADVLFDSEPRWNNLQVKNPNFNTRTGCVCKGCYSLHSDPPRDSVGGPNNASIRELGTIRDSGGRIGASDHRSVQSLSGPIGITGKTGDPTGPF